MPAKSQTARVEQMAKASRKPIAGIPPVESGVKKPLGKRRTADTTFAARLRELEVGDTESRSKRLSGDTALAEAVASAKVDLDGSVTSSMRNAKTQMPGAEFATAVGEYRARNGDVIVTIAVTRTA
jgi:hypothetical protein